MKSLLKLILPIAILVVPAFAMATTIHGKVIIVHHLTPAKKLKPVLGAAIPLRHAEAIDEIHIDE